MSKKYIILNDTSSFHIGCNIVIQNLINNLGYIKNSDIKTFPSGFSKKLIKKIKREILSSDAVIINGEGTVHDGKGEHLLELGLFAKQNNKSVYLINSVYQNNPKRFKKYLEKFDLIIVRESSSQKSLENIGIDSEVMSDLTLLTDIIFEPDKSRKNSYFFSDSVLIKDTKVLLRLFDKKYVYIPPFIAFNIENIKEYLLRNFYLFKLKKVFKAFFNKVLSFMFGRKNKYKFKNISEYVNILKSTKGVITGRFHTVCLCLLTETPFVAIESNTHKISGMLSDIGINNRLIKIEEIHENIKISKFSEEEIRKIRIYIECNRKKWKRFFDSIKLSEN